MRSSWLRDAGVAACAALALAAAFPKFGAAWLVPFGTAALFWTWQGASWKHAGVLGWFAGVIFFTIGFSWIGHTVGSYIGVFGPVLPLAVALIEAPFFALAAILASFAYRNVRPAFAPLAAAAAFTACEWIRTIGVLGAPFDQLGYSQADTPLRAIAAYAGTYGVTFVLCAVGAYFADAVIRRTWKTVCRNDRRRRRRDIVRVARVARAPRTAADDSGCGSTRQHRAVAQVEFARLSRYPLHRNDASSVIAPSEARRVARNRHSDLFEYRSVLYASLSDAFGRLEIDARRRQSKPARAQRV